MAKLSSNKRKLRMCVENHFIHAINSWSSSAVVELYSSWTISEWLGLIHTVLTNTPHGRH